MEAHQEVRLKEAEAADQKKRLTETRSLNQPEPIIEFIRGVVQPEFDRIGQEKCTGLYHVWSPARDGALPIT